MIETAFKTIVDLWKDFFVRHEQAEMTQIAQVTALFNELRWNKELLESRTNIRGVPLKIDAWTAANNSGTIPSSDGFAIVNDFYGDATIYNYQVQVALSDRSIRTQQVVIELYNRLRPKVDQTIKVVEAWLETHKAQHLGLWRLAAIVLLVIAGLGLLVWHKTQPHDKFEVSKIQEVRGAGGINISEAQQVRGAGGVNIADLKAGRDVNISITSSGQQAQTSSTQIAAPVIHVAPVEFVIYKPSRPQAPGQEKAWIKVQMSNHSSFYDAYNVHVRFLTDDGMAPKHKADSDEWNSKMGTPSLYTFDAIPPRGVEEAVWRPDIPRNSQELYSTGKARFTLATYVSWEDLAHKRYESLDIFELAYNHELNGFVLENKASYNSFFDGDKIREVLGNLSQ